MCLISVLGKTKEKNTEEVFKFIRNGASCNGDGSGIMWKRNGENIINISKGYFDIEELIEKIKILDLTVDDELVVHHRIGTSGRVSAENTHPFIITTDESESLETETITINPCMVHNGIFSNIGAYERLNPMLSDTYAFSRYIMPNLLGILNQSKSVFKEMTSNIVGFDKICILHPDKDLELIGNFIESNGYYHSNSGYCRQVFNRGGNEDWFGGHRAFPSQTGGTKEGFNLPVVITKKNKEAKEGTCNIDLDGKLIKINSTNYFHFYYVNKNIVDLTFRDKAFTIECNRWEMDTYESGNEYQSLFKGFGESNTALKTENLDNLHRSYYFIPKDKRLLDVYTDYLILLKRFPNSNNSAIKKLNKLTNSNKKTMYEKIRYDKLDYPVYKLTLILYLDYLKNKKELVLTELN